MKSGSLTAWRGRYIRRIERQMHMETWKPVSGYEGWYEVSDRGRVRRVKSGKGARLGNALKPWDGSIGGYNYVTLTRDGEQLPFAVHRLVYGAFCRPIGDGEVVHHRNHNTRDNRPENLEAMARSEHAGKAAEEGRHARGETNGQARLREEDVLAIRSRYGEKVRALAAEYGVCPGAISSIQTGRLWAHVGGPRKTSKRRLTAVDAQAIRRRAQQGGRGWAVKCAEDYGVSRSYVYQVVNGVCWRD